MKHFINLSCLLLFLATFLFGCTKKASEKPAPITFQQKIDSLFSTVPDFSGVVLIADKGKPIFHKAFGYRNFETKTPLDTTDIFELASVSKQFTAMAVMMLKEEGKLSYDEPLEKYIPGLPYPNITIRHLLTHTSGLPDYQAIMDRYWDKSKVANNADIVAYLNKYHPPSVFAPGEKYEYSNTGYVLLASIFEKASGKDFIAFCRERIFGPLQMKDTDIRSLEEKKSIENFALGHMYVDERKKYVRADSFPSSNYTIWLGNRKGPGRISSTASDLLKWDRALYTEKIILQSALKEAFTAYTLNSDSLSHYGFGWILEEKAGAGRIVWHDGDNPGYKTIIIRLIDQDKTIIVLSNNAHGKFKNLVEEIKNLLLKTE
jgi:CubicO group peptidase (beta-lactamase class C family)